MNQDTKADGFDLTDKGRQALVTRIDCRGVCGYGQEDAVLAAYLAGDYLELGMIAKRRIEQCAADRIKYRNELKDSLRAEILAEVCAGGEA